MRTEVQLLTVRLCPPSYTFAPPYIVPIRFKVAEAAGGPQWLNFGRQQVVNSARGPSMQIPNIFAVVLTGLTVLFVVGLVLFRLLWAGSQLAGFGTLPRGLEKLQRWLQGEGNSVSTEQRR